MSNYRYKCVDEGNFINFFLSSRRFHPHCLHLPVCVCRTLISVSSSNYFFFHRLHLLLLYRFEKWSRKIPDKNIERETRTTLLSKLFSGSWESLRSFCFWFILLLLLLCFGFSLPVALLGCRCHCLFLLAFVYKMPEHYYYYCRWCVIIDHRKWVDNKRIEKLNDARERIRAGGRIKAISQWRWTNERGKQKTRIHWVRLLFV